MDRTHPRPRRIQRIRGPRRSSVPNRGAIAVQSPPAEIKNNRFVAVPHRRSLGGGLGFTSSETEPIPPETRSDDQTNILLEGGAQIRFFPVPNVAVSASAGLAVLSGDADLFALTGQLTGGAGLTYFF